MPAPHYHEATLKASGRDFLDYSTTHTSNTTFVSTSGSDPFRDLLNNTAVAAMHNSADRCDAPKCHPETRVAVQEQILGWAGYGGHEPVQQRVLWLSGPAGTGKTAIMGTIADTLKKDGKLAASFFFSSFSKSKERGVKDHFVTTIVYQLTQHEGLENLKSAILSSIQKDPSVFKKCLEEQAEALVLKPLRQVALRPGTLPEVIIVDGLDECGAIIHDGLKDSERSSAQNLRESDQLEVLSILQDLAKDPSCPFRIIVASRPETVIKVSFSCIEPQTSSIFLDDKYDPDADITLFLKAKFAQIRLRYPRISPAWPCEADIQQLVRNASGQFIYAATVIRFMETRRSAPLEQLKIVLKTRPTDLSLANPLELLDVLYGQVVKSSHKPIEALTWLKAYCTLDIAGSFGPTRAWFWCKLCELSEGEADFLLEKLSALLCASDLDAPYEASIVFYHKSFQDFLSDPSRYRAQFPDLSDEMAGEWLIQRFESALQLAERQPQVRLVDPYFQDVFDAIVPLYWRAIPRHAGDRTERMRTIQDACKMVDKRFAFRTGLRTDIVIVVTGLSGSGVSTLFNRLLGWNAAAVCLRLDSATTLRTQVNVACHAPIYYSKVNELLRGRRIVFLDTPGLDIDSMDPDWGKSVIGWLRAKYPLGMPMGGLLCLQDVAQTRQHDRYVFVTQLAKIRKLWGPDTHISWVTTKWDLLRDFQLHDALSSVTDLARIMVNFKILALHLRPQSPIPSDLEQALGTLQAQDPWEIVCTALGLTESGEGPQPLIRDELVNKNLPWEGTTAGRGGREATKGKGPGHRGDAWGRALKDNEFHPKHPKLAVPDTAPPTPPLPPMPASGSPGPPTPPSPTVPPPPAIPPPPAVPPSPAPPLPPTPASRPPPLPVPPVPPMPPIPPIPPPLPLHQRLRRWVCAWCACICR